LNVYFNLAAEYLFIGNIPKVLDIYLSAIINNPLFIEFFWEHNFQLSPDSDVDTKYQILEVSAAYGDAKASELLRNGTWMNSSPEIS
jgi:hypothetical protein